MMMMGSTAVIYKYRIEHCSNSLPNETSTTASTRTVKSHQVLRLTRGCDAGLVRGIDKVQT